MLEKFCRISNASIRNDCVYPFKGPDAANLSGSRSGAERVGSKLNELLETQWSVNDTIHVAQDQHTSSAIRPEAAPNVPQGKGTRTRQKKHFMGARQRRAGNIGGWFEGLEEVEA